MWVEVELSWKLPTGTELGKISTEDNGSASCSADAHAKVRNRRRLNICVEETHHGWPNKTSQS